MRRPEKVAGRGSHPPRRDTYLRYLGYGSYPRDFYEKSGSRRLRIMKQAQRTEERCARGEEYAIGVATDSRHYQGVVRWKGAAPTDQGGSLPFVLEVFDRDRTQFRNAYSSNLSLQNPEGSHAEHLL